MNSALVGVAKPDPAMFEAAMAVAGTGPAATLFIDDTVGHVAAARRLGLATHRHDGDAEHLAHGVTAWLKATGGNLGRTGV